MTEAYTDVPIAIVGMGIRFPGNNNTPQDFADFLNNGRSGITKLPEGRLPQGVPDDVCTDGGYLTAIDGFDSGFFNISPREAAFIDPQHRLTLETAWEALENAGIDPTSLRHGDTGVYVAVTGMDYAMEIARLPVDQVELYAGTGMFHCGASGRVSYFMGLRGPSMSVDGACASSLVAVHLAVQGLRMGECSLALCGAANLISDPAYPVMASRSGVLADDARCKTFDEAGDGYVRGEGVAMIALKRLDDARRDGDRVLALIRGSAVRQDGESAALMAPNGKAQALLMRAALNNAGLAADDIQYVEAHGTGTALGDPIEISGITEVFSGSHSADKPIVVGSVKTNIGHLESTAGMAGLIKTVLQLQNRTIYPHLNFATPSRSIPWDRSPVRIPVEPTPWTGGSRRALVNSYGATGTIASVVLEEADPEPSSSTQHDSVDAPVVFTLSAKNARSLHGQLDAYAAFLTDTGDTDLADLCYTSNVGRAHHPWRVAAAVRSTAELTRFIDRQRSHHDRRPPTTARKHIALMFSGGGSQYPGMGLPLYQRFPVFKTHIDRCSDLFESFVDYSVRDEILRDTDGQPIPTGAGVLTARLFSLEYALAKLWLSMGVRPSVLIGHSLGEIVAATIAGIFSLEDAVQLVSRRGELLDKTSTGAMAAVEAPREQIEALLTSHPDLSLGAVNGPSQCVVSGGANSLAEVAARLESAGVKVKRLQVPVASHSPLMDEISDDYRAVLEQMEYSEPEFAIASTTTGRIAQPGEMTRPDHWMRHLHDTVDFADAFRAIEDRGRHIFLEIGPGTELTGMGRECASDEGHLWLGSMHRSDRSGTTMLQSASRLYSAGLPISWKNWHQGAEGTRVTLPTYAFDRKPYWLPQPDGTVTTTTSAQLHPLLGQEVPSDPEHLAEPRTFESRISASRPAYLAEHDLNGTPVFPGTGFVEMLMALQDAVFGETTRPVHELTFHEPLFLSANSVALRTCAHQEPEGALRVEITSRIGSVDHTVDRLHVSAHIKPHTDHDDGTNLRRTADRLRPLPTSEDTAELTLNTADLDAHFQQHGAGYGPTFRTLRRAERYVDATVIGVIEGRRAAPADFLHPALLAGALQSSAGLFHDRMAEDTAFVSVGAEQAQLFRKPRGTVLRSILRAVHNEEEQVTAELAVLDEDGSPVFCMTGLRFQRVSTAPTSPRHGTSKDHSQSADPSANEHAAQTPAFDLQEWNGMSEEQRRESANAFLLATVTQLLHYSDPGDIPEGVSFFELGMDSLIAVRLKNVAETAFRVPLDARTIFQNPTVEALADALVSKAAPDAPTEGASDEQA
ncbi:beta-ketoacyl synthase N-terminal-like domain-containing protein [Streptomyces sp. DSM 42041]|uniref:Beta-ketoacyl synthase N-terminal-like domain-containing protein n=1 Tax=Streptomyces hazeniae TaxID=3075538 RepID=A0ABU2NYT6_9ACTN|nr:beta-ketoacyl synthase N-terminal-like domain-containing protein [Streptomyces sp. DSM 42041]MDT0382151.1 beta-ketoacyl synthase N-terminal-like domain-containing protein [Streptomyces sp. DSM 42041]